MAHKILAKDGRPVKKDGDPVLAMDYTVEKIEQLDDTNKSFIAVASTEDEDRDKDIVRVAGWDLRNFKKNPMIPWSHDYWGVPVARSLRTWVDHESKRLLFKPQFDAADETSMKIFNKYKNGFLTSFSVGFRGIEVEYRDPEDRWFGGREFKKQELLEISGVTIPANPNATVNLMSGGNAVQNLLQIGYPQMFAETEQGLFYPVRELGEFINPEIKSISDIEGVQAVYACSMNEDGTTGDSIPVAYYFDPNQWQTENIKQWINDNTGGSYPHHYYNWKWIEENGTDKATWKVETQEEEKEIPVYDEPVKVNVEIKIESKEEDNKKVDEEFLNELGSTIEKMISEKLADQLQKLTDGLAKAFDQIFDKILVQLDEIKKLISEKSVDSNLKMSDNIEDNTGNSNDFKSDINDEFEVDDSLISPNDNKSDSDDIIEIDGDEIGIDKEIATTVTDVFRQKLQKTIHLVKQEKSIN